MTSIPFRQIRAKYDNETITVYQAYSSEIALPAVEHQKLNVSPKFSTTRMSWIKPSWAWMLYRSGYSYKDPGQSHILALSLSHETFVSLLRKAVVAPIHGMGDSNSGVGAKSQGRGKATSVRVQWDPERTVDLEKLPYRSIQVGVPGTLVGDLMDGIVKIEDVTEKARELKRLLSEDANRKMGIMELIEKDLIPVEQEFKVDEELRQILCMDEVDCESLEI